MGIATVAPLAVVIKYGGRPNQNVDRFLIQVRIAARAYETGYTDAAELNEIRLMVLRENIEPNSEAHAFFHYDLSEEEQGSYDLAVIKIKEFGDRQAARAKPNRVAWAHQQLTLLKQRSRPMQEQSYR
jgi:hypothetical protein